MIEPALNPVATEQLTSLLVHIVVASNVVIVITVVTYKLLQSRT